MFHVYEFVHIELLDVSEISNDFATPTVRLDCPRREMQHGLDMTMGTLTQPSPMVSTALNVILKHKISKFSIIFSNLQTLLFAKSAGQGDQDCSTVYNVYDRNSSAVQNKWLSWTNFCVFLRLNILKERSVYNCLFDLLFKVYSLATIFTCNLFCAKCYCKYTKNVLQRVTSSSMICWYVWK